MRSAWIRLSLTALAATGVISSVGLPAASASTSGVNDWSCQPTAAHPNPVVLVHGLGTNDSTNFATLGPAISAKGYCVYSKTYGTTNYGPYTGGLAPMATSAAEIGTFVDKVLASTGATKTDIVGHSEGTTVPAYYMKVLGGAAKVNRFVGFGSNYQGTTLDGLSALGSALGISNTLNNGGCGACSDFLPGSAFLNTLDTGGVAVAGPTYTNIVTKYDEVVTPYTSGIINAPNVTNIVLQDVCANDSSGHIGLAVDPNVQSLVLNALDPAHASAVNCQYYSSGGF